MTEKDMLKSMPNFFAVCIFYEDGKLHVECLLNGWHGGGARLIIMEKVGPNDKPGRAGGHSRHIEPQSSPGSGTVWDEPVLRGCIPTVKRTQRETRPTEVV